MGTTFTAELESLSFVVDRDGLAAHEAAVSALVLRARSLGLRGVALDVLADGTEPIVARERALGRVGFIPAGPAAPVGFIPAGPAAPAAHVAA